MAANYHGRDLDLPSARKIVSSLGRGASLKTLSYLADHFEFSARAVQVPADDPGGLTLPAILHWDNNHFVVLERLRSGRALIHDPNGFSRWISLTDVAHHFTGFAFEMEPLRHLEPVRASRGRTNYLISHIGGMTPKMIHVIFLTLFLQVAALATPYFAQVALDKALPAHNSGFLAVISIAFIAFILLNGCLSLLRLNLILRIGAIFSDRLASGVAGKLFRLPIDWFRKREPGEILSQFQSVLPVKHALSENLPAAVINTVLAVLTLIMMLIYSPALTLAGILTFALYATVRGFLLPRQKAALSEMLQAIGKEQAFLLSSFHCMRSLRLSCQETARHDLWRSKLKDFLEAEVRYKRLNNFQNAFQTTLLSLSTIIALWIAVTLAMQGEFTAGMVFAYMSYMTQFMSAGMEVVNKYSSLRELDSYLVHLGDILETEDDPAFLNKEVSTRIPLGKIELKGISYRYGLDSPFVLEDANMVIEPGEAVAITGPSGAGKSTLAQILLGLQRPTSGSILVDDVDLKDFGYRNYFRHVAAVLQDESLFAGTVLENIALFSGQADMAFVEECARAAAIDAEIRAWPMGYQTLVGDMGMAISSGQRQRILLARALHSRPKILLLDEATAHLDSHCEARVNEAIRKLGITRIIFAHRKETIESADRILALRAGKIVDARGLRLEASHG